MKTIWTAKQRWPGFVLLMTLPFVLYTLTMPTSYTVGDPYDELTFVESGETVLRPHHLLLTPVLRAAAVLMSPLPGTPLLHLQIFTAICGALTILGLFVLAGKDLSAGIVALLASVFNGFWIHASTLETGAAALCALTWGLHFYMHGSTHRRALIGLLLFSFSVLLHAHNLILLPSFLLLRRSELPTLRRYLGNAAIVIAVTGVVMIAASIIATKSIKTGELIGWLLTHHSSSAIEQFGGVFLSLARSFSGALTLLVALDGGGTAIRYALSGGSLSMADLLTISRPFAAAAIGLIGVAILWRSRRESRGELRQLLFAACLLLITNAFWLGSDPQFWLGIIPFIAIPLASGLRSLHRPGIVVSLGGIVILLLLFLNLPQREPSLVFPQGDRAHQRAMQFNSMFPHALLLTPGSRWTTVVSLTSESDVHQIFRWTAVDDPLSMLEKVMQEALQKRRQIVFEGFEEDPASEVVETWRVVKRVNGLDAQAIESMIQQRFSAHLSDFGSAPNAESFDLRQLVIPETHKSSGP